MKKKNYRKFKELSEKEKKSVLKLIGARTLIELYFEPEEVYEIAENKTRELERNGWKITEI